MALKAYLGVLALVAAERAVELFVSRRNARLALLRGAVEHGADHFRWMALLHAAFLPACALEAAWRGGALHPGPLLVVLGAQGLRFWVVASLGSAWNVRILVLPGGQPVRRGPYRYVRHPNYVAVVLEMLFLPLAGGAFVCAALFSALNALVLRVRIRDEERALGDEYQRAFAQVPRFIPHG